MSTKAFTIYYGGKKWQEDKVKLTLIFAIPLSPLSQDLGVFESSCDDETTADGIDQNVFMNYMNQYMESYSLK